MKHFANTKEGEFPLALLSPPSDIQLSTSHHGDCVKVVLIMLSVGSRDPRAFLCLVHGKPTTQSHRHAKKREPAYVACGQSLTEQEVGEAENTSQYPSYSYQGDRKRMVHFLASINRRHTSPG